MENNHLKPMFLAFLCLAHSQRLVHVKSRLKQAPRYQTLERDLIEYQERQLFEYFVVVSLHKKQACAPYVPEVTQQFPLKVGMSLSAMIGFCPFELLAEQKRHFFPME